MRKKNIFFLVLLLCNTRVLSADKILQEYKADIIIFSYDRPLQLYALLESLQKYVSHINSTTIIYRTSNERYNNGFKIAASDFPLVTFLQQQSIYDFKTLTLQALTKSTSPYVVFAVDDNIVKDVINLHECIEWLEHENAYGFYLQMGLNLHYCYTENAAQVLPPKKQVSADVFSWEFDLGEKDWHYPNTVDMTLY